MLTQQGIKRSVYSLIYVTTEVMVDPKCIRVYSIVYDT